MKQKDIIIAIAFLLVVSFFSFNFENITGFQVKGEAPVITITPDNGVKAGQPVEIRVKINDYCVDPTFEFYKGLRKDRQTYKPTEDDCAEQNFHTCKGLKYCKGDLKNDEIIMKYYTHHSWSSNPGLYSVRVHYMEKPGQNRYNTPYAERTFRITS